VIAVGDWLSEHRVNEAAAGFAPPGVRVDHGPLMAPIAPIIASADVAICHMETPISGPGAPYGWVGTGPFGSSLLAAPHELAGDLQRVGFDRCSTASNHSWDLGIDGIASTLAALDDVGISHTGTARSPQEAVPDVFEVEGTKVAHLSFALNSNSGFPRDPWRLNRVVSSDSVIDAVADVRRRGAEVVIVSLHVFVEIRSTPHPNDRQLVERILAESDPDLVVIHGPHTIQPLEIVNGVPVFWSLGNFTSGMGTPNRGKYSDLRTLDGLLASVRFTEQPDGSFAAVAAPVLLCQVLDGRVVYPGLAQSAVPIPAQANGSLEACRGRSIPVVGGLR
jgi:poly-gamma-glutamate synthesis protein (capsule biosynthesis protein)